MMKMNKNHHKKLEDVSKKVRKSIIKMLVPEESHHIGCALSIVEIAVYLYFHKMNIFPQNPDHPKRDIFILSKGHAASAIYAVLVEKGFFPKSRLKEYDTDGGFLPEHASKEIPGVELSTGSLGHGLPAGLGFAFDMKRKKSTRKVYVLMSDGELNEGSNWEAFMFAAHHKLSNVIAIIDNNTFQGYGKTKDILDIEPLEKKFIAFGWDVHRVDGHDFHKLDSVFHTIESEKAQKPHVIIADTIKGKGVPFFEGKFESHYSSLKKEQKNEILKNMQ